MIRVEFAVIQPRCSKTGSSWSDLSSVSRRPWLPSGALCAVMRHRGRSSLHRSGCNSTYRGLQRRRFPTLAGSNVLQRSAHSVAKHRSITRPPADHPVSASSTVAPAVPTRLRLGSATHGSRLRSGVCLGECSRRRPRPLASCAGQRRNGSAAARQTHPVGSIGAS